MSLDQLALFRDVAYQEERKDLKNDILATRQAFHAPAEELEKIIRTLE